MKLYRPISRSRCKNFRPVHTKSKTRHLSKHFLARFVANTDIYPLFLEFRHDFDRKVGIVLLRKRKWIHLLHYYAYLINFTFNLGQFLVRERLYQTISWSAVVNSVGQWGCTCCHLSAVFSVYRRWFGGGIVENYLHRFSANYIEQATVYTVFAHTVLFWLPVTVCS